MKKIIQEIPVIWRNRIMNDSSKFKDSSKASEILAFGYALMMEMHDRLSKISSLESVVINGDWNGDEYTKELYFIDKERDRIEKEFRKGAKHLFLNFSSFSSEKQIDYLEMIFRGIPNIKAKSLNELRVSLYGMLQFPRRYIKGLEMDISYTVKDNARHGIDWTPNEFERAYNSYIKRNTNLTGSDGRNEQEIKRKTYPGCYEKSS
ncbi:MAG: hypothetical protein WC867_08165 [Candidatus Pacearchaeota archaeon]|jgi:hypothetical protein